LATLIHISACSPPDYESIILSFAMRNGQNRK
jgi:hypothetical protein